MPTFISLKDGALALAEDPFTTVADEQPVPPGDVIVSLTRFEAEGEGLLSEGRSVGVRLESHEQVETLAYDLPRLAVVSLVFPKFGDGRAYSFARLLRERTDGERFLDTFRRTGVAPFKEAVYADVH